MLKDTYNFNQKYSDFKQEEKTPYFSLFSSCHRKEMSFIRTYATKSLFSPHSMVCIHISKLHSKNRELGILIFIRKLLKYLPTLSQFYTEIVDFHWVHIRSLNLWSTVNQYGELMRWILEPIKLLVLTGAERDGKCIFHEKVLKQKW